MQQGPASSFAMLWFLLTGAVILGLPALAIGTALLLRAARSRGGRDAAPSRAEAAAARDAASAAARAQARRSVRWGLAGLTLGALAGAFLFFDQAPWLPVLCCCGAGYLCGLLAGEYAHPPAPGQQRTALLRPRRAAEYAPRWALIAIAAVSAALVSAVTAMAVAPPIRYGQWHPADAPFITLPGGSTSWPSGAALAGGLCLAAAVLLAGAAGLHRVAARPPVTGDPGQEIEELLRHQSGRAIAGAVLNLLLLVLAAVLVEGSDGLNVPVSAISPAAYNGHTVMFFSGLGLAGASLLSVLLLSGSTRRCRSPVIAALRPQP